MDTATTATNQTDTTRAASGEPEGVEFGMRCILLLDLTVEELLALAEHEDLYDVVEVERMIWMTEGICEAKRTWLSWKVRKDEFDGEWDVKGFCDGEWLRKWGIESEEDKEVN